MDSKQWIADETEAFNEEWHRGVEYGRKKALEEAARKAAGMAGRNATAWQIADAITALGGE